MIDVDELIDKGTAGEGHPGQREVGITLAVDLRPCRWVRHEMSSTYNEDPAAMPRDEPRNDLPAGRRTDRHEKGHPNPENASADNTRGI